MRITRGDNFAFLFLPALTLSGMAGAFVASKIYNALNPTVISVDNNTSEDISNLTVRCLDSSHIQPVKKQSSIEVTFGECWGDVSISNQDLYFGNCKGHDEGFKRLEIHISDKKLAQIKCDFHD